MPMLLGAARKLSSAPLRQALHRAARAVKSQSGKALLRKRGMHLERGFEHILDQGGLRRATLKEQRISRNAIRSPRLALT